MVKTSWFRRHLTKEVFSFMGLIFSIITFLFNTFTSKLIPLQFSPLDSETQSYISNAEVLYIPYILFSAFLLGIATICLYVLLKGRIQHSKTKWGLLALCILICFIPGILGSLSMIGSIDGWYATLNKPWFTPPSWLFGPVWTTLYVLMGISLYFIASSKIYDKNILFLAFGTQLLFNGLWTPVFFAWQMVAYSLIIILSLDAVVAITISLFYRYSKKAAYLLVPYMIWLIIATLLNLGILLLN